MKKEMCGVASTIIECGMGPFEPCSTNAAAKLPVGEAAPKEQPVVAELRQLAFVRME